MLTPAPAGDNEVGRPRLTDEQAASIANAVFTPELQRSIAAQMEPILTLSRRWNEQLAQMMRPVIDQVAAQQRYMAKTLEVSLAKYAEAQSRLILTPEFTRALETLRDASRINLELPDEDGFDRLARLIDTGEISDETVTAAETGLADQAELTGAIDDAAEHLRASRTWMTRSLARQVIMVWVWLMWTAATSAIALSSPAPVGVVMGMSGMLSADKGAQAAGKVFDKVRPPRENETTPPADDD